jgi:hypothetical protein
LPLAYPGQVVDHPRAHHRPVRLADLTAMSDAERDAGPAALSELAAATAAAVIRAGRAPDGTPLVDLADRVGLDTLAELWRREQPSSLPGALWALYLLRRWCQLDGEGVTRLWRAGRPYAPADEVVAGVADEADPAAVERLADAVLTGAYAGDFAVALERAAAFFRVIAAGRLESAPDGAAGDRERRLAERNVTVAEGLSQAADGWRQHAL